ncbi:MAG: 3-keto-5-aminohexanoate cleavage protein, partial [Solirubrobacteraceae bacterium]
DLPGARDVGRQADRAPAEAIRRGARMSIEDPAIITCAISGALADRAQCPAIPYTPAEYAAEARRIVDEGGVHIHIHARTPDGAPSQEVVDFAAIRDAIVDEVGDAAIINFSTGTVGVPVEKRVAYLEACRPEVAALNMGSLNYAKYSRSRREFVFRFVFANPFEEIVELLQGMRRLGIKPEHECFDLGHVGSLEPLVEIGLLEAPLHADFVMGVLGGVPATARNLAAMAENLSLAWPGRRHHWGVIGIGRAQWGMVAAAATLGGSVRVGLEDNFYLPGGEMARSNGELVARARRLVQDCGRRPATVQEARALLGIRAGAPAA